MALFIDDILIYSRSPDERGAHDTRETGTREAEVAQAVHQIQQLRIMSRYCVLPSTCDSK
jgi:hypothetical protein